MTVGSEMSGGVRNVFAYDNDLGGETALRIKTLPGRGGFMDGIHYDTIRVTAAKLGLEVTTNYQSGTQHHLPALRAVRAGVELDYLPVAGAVRRGTRPPRLPPLPRSG